MTIYLYMMKKTEKIRLMIQTRFLTISKNSRRTLKINRAKMLHRNSQKRYYVENSVCFITTKTYENFPYFEEDILCNLFVEDLGYSQKMKLFKIFGYKINLNHIHLLIKPSNEYNYSDIMHNIKRNFSHNANIILGVHDIVGEINGKAGCIIIKGDDCGIKGDDNYRRLYKCGNVKYKKLWNHDILLKYKTELNAKFHNNHPYPNFKWQKSFHNHIIEDTRDLLNHIEYIKNQNIKHCLNRNVYCFINNELIQELI